MVCHIEIRFVDTYVHLSELGTDECGLKFTTLDQVRSEL